MSRKIELEHYIENNIFQIGRLFADAGKDIYLVGGAVRDILTGRSPSDFDFTTSAAASEIRNIIRSVSKAVFDKSRAKGYETQGILLSNDVEIEITPFRRAIFMENTRGCPTLDEDLGSRDFTINALAVSLSPDDSGTVFDPFGGADDLENGVLRTPADPMSTFRDDPLRPLRAVRFCVSFGLDPDAGLVAAVRQTVNETDWLDRVAVERVREEVEKMLLDDAPSRYFALMRDWELLKVWLPEVDALAEMTPEPGTHHKDVFEHTLKVLDTAAATGPRDAAFRFAALLHDIGKVETRRLENGEYSFHGHEKKGAEQARVVCERMRWSNVDRDHIVSVIAKHSRVAEYSNEWTDSAVRRAVHDMGRYFDELIALARADITSSDRLKVAERLASVDRFLERVDGIEREVVLNPRPPLDGYEIMQLLGVTPGPVVGHVTNFLKDMIISGELESGDADTARRVILDREWNINGQ